jgi:hypothetical protein
MRTNKRIYRLLKNGAGFPELFMRRFGRKYLSEQVPPDHTCNLPCRNYGRDGGYLIIRKTGRFTG